MIPARYLLWIDCAGALLAGIIVFLLSEQLVALHRFPKAIIMTIATANVAYGCFSLSLARWRQRPQAMIVLLAAANVTWALACIAGAAMLWSEASLFGLAHLLLEGAYVAFLATNEWIQREKLASDSFSISPTK